MVKFRMLVRVIANYSRCVSAFWVKSSLLPVVVNCFAAVCEFVLRRVGLLDEGPCSHTSL